MQKVFKKDFDVDVSAQAPLGFQNGCWHLQCVKMWYLWTNPEEKEDCELFSRLFIACQSREGSLDEFFTFENPPWPPSLAQSGKLRSGQKADLIKCILNQAADPPSNFQADAVILDCSVIVQMLTVKTARTFDEYFNAIFAPYVLHQLETANRVDLVFDE